MDGPVSVLVSVVPVPLLFEPVVLEPLLSDLVIPVFVLVPVVPVPLLPDPELCASTNGAVTRSTARAATTVLLNLLNVTMLALITASATWRKFA
jgi:hypothetical protein